jgi:hypothetical protein
MRTLSRRCLIPIDENHCFCYFNARITKGEFAHPDLAVLGIKYSARQGFRIYYGKNELKLGDFETYSEGTYSFDSRYFSNEILASFEFILQCIGVSLNNVDICTFEC